MDFEILLINQEKIFRLASSAEDYATMWSKFLVGTGWDEYSFTQEYCRIHNH